MTNLRLRASWRAAWARLPPASSFLLLPADLRTPPRESHGPAPPPPRSQECGKRVEAGGAGAGPSRPPSTQARACVCVAFPPSTLISVSSAPPRSREDPERLTPCVLPHAGLRGLGVRGWPAGTGASASLWPTRVAWSPLGAEWLAQARPALPGSAGLEARGG